MLPTPFVVGVKAVCPIKHRSGANSASQIGQMATWNVA